MPTSLETLAAPLRDEHIAIIFGGVSPEHEISILSASQVLASLLRLRESVPFTLQPIYINREGAWIWRPADVPGLTPELVLAAEQWDVKPETYATMALTFPQALTKLAALPVDRALLVLHGPGGEDGRLQAAFDLAGVAYTGSGALASGLCLNKPRCQAVLNAARLPIARSGVVHAGADIAGAAAKLPEVLGLPCVIKPASGGSSVGMSIVTDPADVQAALERALEVDDEVMVEQFVTGREFTCGVLEVGDRAEALPVTEIIPPEGTYFDYQAKYFDATTREITPAEIPDATARRIQELAVMAHLAAGCRGFSRVDFICDVSSSAEPTILEINTIPGMTARSLLPQAAACRGINFEELLARMLLSARCD